MSKKQLLGISVVIYLVTVLFELGLELIWLKYTSFALAMFCLGDIWISATQLRLQRGNEVLRLVTVAVLTCYVILCFDTFVLHVQLPLPAMITYAVFDFYLPLSILFLIDGMLYAYAKK